MVNVGLIGVGYWGKKYLKTIESLEGIGLRWLYNRRNPHPSGEIPEGARFTRDYNEIVRDAETEAVIICTPPHTHYPIAKAMLEAGKDVLVEKPMTATSQEALELVRLAERSRKILMVGHIFLYNSAVNELKRMVESGEFGTLFYLYARRTGRGLRTDVSCLWDLAPHDIAIMNHLNNGVPLAISARGASYLSPGLEDVVDLVVTYDGQVNGFIHLSRLEPIKSREITVVGEKKLAVFDDTVRERLRVYESDHVENVVCPELDSLDPLANQCLHFRDCVETRKQPFTDGYQGYVNMKILECAQQSLETGKTIPVPSLPLPQSDNSDEGS